MTSPVIQCAWCRHFHRDRFGGNFCDSFPDDDGIPLEIIEGRHDHRRPHPDDNGILFEPLPGESHPFDEPAE